MEKTSKKEWAAIAVAAAISVPILLIYIAFFRMAFLNNEGEWTLANFQFLFQSITLKQTVVEPIARPLLNTIWFTVLCTIGEVVVSAMAGYAIARMEFRGKKTLMGVILVLRLFPGILLLIAMMYVLLYLNLINTMMGVVLVAIALRLPASTYIIKGFFDHIPKDIENSALIDGCTRLSAFFQVILSMVKPGLASIGLFAFMSAWSNYILFNTLIFNNTPFLATYIRSLSRNEQMIADYGVFTAMALVYMIPIIVFFFITQKQLMNANFSGGKGI